MDSFCLSPQYVEARRHVAKNRLPLPRNAVMKHFRPNGGISVARTGKASLTPSAGLIHGREITSLRFTLFNIFPPNTAHWELPPSVPLCPLSSRNLRLDIVTPSLNMSYIETVVYYYG
jgi:hypothetical protein